MKNLLYLLAIIIGTSAFTSCNNSCKDTVCRYGICSDGYCHCHDGYEGDNCELLIRDKMLGNYVGTLNCAGKPQQKNISATITAATDKGLENYIHIKYADTSLTKLCSVHSGNTFKYNFNNGSKVTYSIEGKYYDEQITFTEEVVENGTTTYSCTYVGEKQ